MSTITGNFYVWSALIVLALVGYGALVHYWPSIKEKLPFVGSRVSRELDRENADLEMFVKKAHDSIDAEIAKLQERKQKVAAAVEEVKKIVQ